MLNIQHLIDDAKCFEVIRELRWPDEVRCPDCESGNDNLEGPAKRLTDYCAAQGYRVA